MVSYQYIYLTLLCLNLGNDNFHIRQQSYLEIQKYDHNKITYAIIDGFANNDDYEIEHKIRKIRKELIDKYVIEKHGEYPWITEEVIHNKSYYIDKEYCPKLEWPLYRVAMENAIIDLLKTNNLNYVINIIEKCKEKEIEWKKKNHGKIINY